MSLKAWNTLWKIDVVLIPESKDPIGLFTFDISNSDDIIESPLPEGHEFGNLLKLTQYETINIEGFKDKGVDYMFTLDRDIVGA